MKFPRLLTSASILFSLFFLGCSSAPTSEHKKELTLAYAEPITSFSPLLNDAVNRQYLAQWYEPLVQYDQSFNLESGLAVSWGRLDDTHWDFHLREGVVFHDGSTFDAQDAVYSLNMARTDPSSEFSSLLSNVQEVRATESFRLEVVTKEPSPLLLQALTRIYIFPENYTAFEKPIGTGAYRVSSLDDNVLISDRFNAYWGPLPYFEILRQWYLPDPAERISAFEAGKIDLLADVPPQQVPVWQEADVNLNAIPSLENSFLMMNQKGPLLDLRLRELIFLSLGTDYAEVFGASQLKTNSQFATQGIGGYFSDLKDREQKQEEALALRALLPPKIALTLSLPPGLTALGERIKSDLSLVHIDLEIETLEIPDLEEKIDQMTLELYFFGWKYDLADSADFFGSVLHSRGNGYGTFNGISYANPQVDEWIESAETRLDVSLRSELLRKITDQLLKEKVILPLFESQSLEAHQKNIHFAPRLDGQILASEIFENVLE